VRFARGAAACRASSVYDDEEVVKAGKVSLFPGRKCVCAQFCRPFASIRDFGWPDE
jgi:hypothetical protein